MTNLMTDSAGVVGEPAGRTESFAPVITHEVLATVLLFVLLLLALDVYLIIHGAVRRRNARSVVGFTTALRVSSIGAMFFFLWRALTLLNFHIAFRNPHWEASGNMEYLLIGVMEVVDVLRLPLPVIALGFIAAHLLSMPREERKDDGPQHPAGG